MAEISKPDYRYVWSSGGANVAPSSTKIQTGWLSEVPPYQWENYLQNRQDNMLVHINQHGMPQWDALTEYFANKSYTLGSDGLVYKAVQNSGPATTTQDPTTDVSDTYWRLAFADAGVNYLTQTTGDARYLQRANNLSDIANASTARNNLGVVPATDTVAGLVELATNAETLTGTSTSLAVHPAGLRSVRSRRIVLLSSATTQVISGVSVAPAVYTPLSYTLSADGGMYSIFVKINLNLNTTAASGSNYVSVKLLDGSTPLDVTSQNIVQDAQYGTCLVLKYSGIMTGTRNLTVTFEKSYATASIMVNGDRDNTTSNDSGQLSLIEIYRTGS